MPNDKVSRDPYLCVPASAGFHVLSACSYSVHQPTSFSVPPIHTANMQLTLQLPGNCNHHCSFDSALETSSNASSGSSSPSWTTASFDEGPPTPAAKCAGLQLQDSTDADCAGKDRRGAYRRLQLEVPCSPGMQNDSNKSVSSARRVLPTCGSYSSVSSWLEQQVSKRSSAGEGLIAACNHTPVGLIPVLEGPITPVQADEAAPALPAPALQLLGLL